MALPQDYRPQILAAEAKDYCDAPERADLIISIIGLIGHLSGIEQADACGLPQDAVPGRQLMGRSSPLSTSDLRALQARLRVRSGTRR